MRAMAVPRRETRRLRYEIDKSIDSRLLRTVATCPMQEGNKVNFGPIIGILSHPSDGASGRLNDAPNVSYIAASYVKFVESAGARVIPLIYN
ncbi:gamma-glutamyl hydrolase 2-like protein isoform X1, partial [Tanacetum coccineum]